MESLYEELCQVDDGRFKPLIDTLNVTDTCRGCHYFDNNIDKQYSYRCHCLGSCIDATVSRQLKEYLLLRINIKAIV